MANSSAKKQKLKGGWLLFFLVFGICVGKDIFDIIAALIDLIGFGLNIIPVIGTAIGMAVDFIMEFVNIIFDMFLSFTMLAYFWYIGGGLGRRLVVTSIGAIIEMVPGLDILPMATITFVLAFFIGRISSSVLASSAAATAVAESGFGKRLVAGVASKI